MDSQLSSTVLVVAVIAAVLLLVLVIAISVWMIRNPKESEELFENFFPSAHQAGFHSQPTPEQRKEALTAKPKTSGSFIHSGQYRRARRSAAKVRSKHHE